MYYEMFSRYGWSYSTETHFNGWEIGGNVIAYIGDFTSEIRARAVGHISMRRKPRLNKGQTFIKWMIQLKDKLTC